MALAIESENDQTCVISTPHTLAAPTTNKTRVLRLDLFNLAAGEALRVQIQTKVRAAGTIRIQYDLTYVGVVGAAIVESVPISSDLGATFIITQINGTGRTIPWKVLTLD
jgi:hypothetical protein